jgi:hypothetical protein
MIQSSRVFRPMALRRLKCWLVSRGPALRFGFIRCPVVFSLVLLTFSPSGVAAASKDPTLRPADSASRIGYETASQPRGTSKAGHGLSAEGKTKTVNLDSQLKQLENNTSKATKIETKSSNRAEPMPPLSSPGDKINLRLPPQQTKGGTSNQLGQGSGSRRYGPGRRVTEKSPWP